MKRFLLLAIVVAMALERQRAAAQTVPSIEGNLGRFPNFTRVAITADGSRVVVGSGREITEWDLRTCMMVR